MASSTVLIPSGPSPRQYILAAMAGTLVASIVIIVVFVVLSPAKIHFFVTDAMSRPSPTGEGAFLNFTLAAVNPSRRAGVKYHDVSVDLAQYTVNQRQETFPGSVLNATVPFYQPPMSSMSMSASSGFLENGFVRKNFGGGGAPTMTVLVIAEVQFKVGVAYSRPYRVKVSCPSVDFFTNKNPSATRVICA